MWRAVRSLRRAVYRLLAWPATAILAKPRVLGREHLRDLEGPALFISNHVTAIDIGFLLFALPPRFRRRLAVAMSGELLRGDAPSPRTMSALRRWWERLQYALVVALFNVQPLPQQSSFRESFRKLGEAADRGYSIVIFPEGKRTTTGDDESVSQRHRVAGGAAAAAGGAHAHRRSVRAEAGGQTSCGGEHDHGAYRGAGAVRGGRDAEEMARELQRRVAGL